MLPPLFKTTEGVVVINLVIIAKVFELKEVSKECLDEGEERDSFDIVDHLVKISGMMKKKCRMKILKNIIL